MGHWDWQTAAALLLVAAAAFWLARRAVRLWRRPQAAGCGSGCGSCPSSGNSRSGHSQPLVTLEISSPRAPREAPVRE